MYIQYASYRVVLISSNSEDCVPLSSRTGEDLLHDYSSPIYCLAVATLTISKSNKTQEIDLHQIY